MSDADGSSPLTRGTRLCRPRTHSRVRLIPAHAGNTAVARALSKSRSAHPRSRGEHLGGADFSPNAGGSSPLTRGTRPCHPRTAAGWRLIPAHAGNTARSKDSIRGYTAHPRSRGEHLPLVSVVLENFGSSPLTRGTHLLTWGFTPYISKIESLWSQSLPPEYTISSHY